MSVLWVLEKLKCAASPGFEAYTCPVLSARVVDFDTQSASDTSPDGMTALHSSLIRLTIGDKEPQLKYRYT